VFTAEVDLFVAYSEFFFPKCFDTVGWTTGRTSAGIRPVKPAAACWFVGGGDVWIGGMQVLQITLLVVSTTSVILSSIEIQNGHSVSTRDRMWCSS